ncbi:hypothetical protein [Sphingobacterium gobiense]|uniref:Uncharacterized protein n=1 Tax=Sphingobacterium gobiense TaxID=1382456 RepID=A0A2S9JUQ3_9SPHI|nr:hypothetical protein [Sphingobacterium gobiense]PRD56983.1 hypothetical protein C5749_07180 [Sphingobacterium gobiense]
MDQQKLPTRTFIPTHVGDARQNWYKTKKKPMLEKLDARIKAPESFIIRDIKAFIVDIEKLIEKSGNLAVYFGAATKGEPDVVLLFAGVKQWSNLPETYYILNTKGAFETITLEKAHALRNNYQNDTATLLHESTDDGYTETEYVFFDKETITEILGEFKYQAEKDRINSLKVQLISYADKATEGRFLRRGQVPKYLQRLSVMFTYVKDGKDTSFEEIDPDRYRSTREAQEGILDSGLNSGRPVPPPPPRNIDPVK